MLQCDICIYHVTSSGRGCRAGPSKGGSSGGDEPLDERLKNIEPKMVELIMSEVCISIEIMMLGNRFM